MTLVERSPSFTTLFDLVDEFLSKHASATLKFWSSYVEMASLLVIFVESSCKGHWKLHLACIRAMLPWMFVYNRTNYSCFMSYYWCQMRVLESTHPMVHEELANGEFVVQRSPVSPRQRPIDLTIEQTVYRDTKSHGGIIGFSRQPGAVQRWIVNSHQRAEIVRNCRAMAGLDPAASDYTHKQQRRSTRVQDEASVEALASTVESWLGPSAVACNEIINISTGAVATLEVARDLERTKGVGEAGFQNIVQQRIISSEVGFFEKISKNKLNTFLSLVTSTKLVSKERAIVLRADQALFARILVIAQSRQMDMRMVLKFDFGALPLFLVSPDGSLTKTTKAKLLA